MSKKHHKKEQPSASLLPKSVFKLPQLKDAVIIVAALIVIAFISRIDNFKEGHPLSFDETVYPFLATQMIETPGVYNTIAIYEDSVRRGRALPEYFNKPLFKHPPFFPWLISVSYGISGMNYVSAFKVSLFFGVLLIPLAYLLGSTLFDERTGVLAALIMAIEPVIWISSQKIWMETTLAFFTVLSLTLFAMSIKRYNGYLVIASGLMGGLAALAKYPGLMAAVIIAMYALAADRGLFRKRSFLSGVILPFLMISPWLMRNFKVYGLRLDLVNDEVADILKIPGMVLGRTWHLMVIAAALLLVFILVKYRAKPFYEKRIFPGKEALIRVFCGMTVVAIFVLVAGNIHNAFMLSHVPEAWRHPGMFYSKPWHFYLGRLIELSPFYIFSFAGPIFMAAEKDLRKQYIFLTISIAVILGFYILWRIFECRYIAAVIVPLMVLGARAIDRSYVFAGRLKIKKWKTAVRLALAVFVLYAVLKTVNIGLALAVPNNICFF